MINYVKDSEAIAVIFSEFEYFWKQKKTWEYLNKQIREKTKSKWKWKLEKNPIKMACYCFKNYINVT